MADYIFNLIFGFTTLVGIILMSSQINIKSKKPKRSILLRSITSAIGGTIFGISLLLLFFYNQSPGAFWQEWNPIALLTFTLCIILPAFFMLVIGMLIQFTTLERWDEAGKNILDKLSKK